jgi:dTDP-4-dehydrorhamnose reductase
MRILITGAKGQLATSLAKILKDEKNEEVVGLGHEELDIGDARSVHETVASVRPDVVINTAAIRRPDVCEQSPDQAFRVNALGPRNLAMVCAQTGSRLVQTSTDSVFDGRANSPYREQDAANPINVYGASKLAGEFFVRSTLDQHYIIRTGGLFGGADRSGKASNFVLAMLEGVRLGQKLSVVTDQFGCPTYTVDLARKIAWLVRTDAYGLYHITNTGSSSWYDFARAIFETAGVEANLSRATTSDSSSAARRLRYSVLDREALRKLDADDLPSWQNALERYLDELGEWRKE